MGAPDAFQVQHIALGPDKHKARVLQGAYSAPEHLPLQTLHEIPGLVAFVGRKDEKGRVLDAVPIFIDGDTPLTATRAGIVLLCEVARDFVIENRLGSHNFTLGNVDTLDAHVLRTYGQTTMHYLQEHWLGKPLGVEHSRWLAKRTLRILRANYPELRLDARQNKSRIVLDRPFTVLAKYDPRVRCQTLLDLAFYLGTTWMTMERQLLTKRPELADRTQYFGDDGQAA